MGGKRSLNVAPFVMTKVGLTKDLAGSEEFLTTDKVMTAVGMNSIALTKLTAETFESQFWSNFDGQFTLTEIQMREDLPVFITDPSNRMKVEAIMDGREETKQLSA
jgi:hypothetical protein